MSFVTKTIAVPAPPITRLGQMHGLDLLTPRQIGNRPSQLEDTVICTRR
jgi:hypothetical protein